MSDTENVNWGPTVVDAIAVLLAAGIAVWGSIRGAKEGAKQGAEATRKATQQAIKAQQESIREQRQQEDRAVIRAAATEFRLNARLLRTTRKYTPNLRLRTPLRQAAR